MPLPPLPSSLKFIQPTLARGQELETREPVIAHFCKLHAAQSILAGNLHLSDPEVADFASALLDQIEQGKSDPESPLATEEYQTILNDDDTAYAYVENFALNVFAKADAEVYDKRSNKVTASKFMAAATFLDVLKVFKELEPSIVEKIKYSKFQAARILKAARLGEDPNAYDPPGVKTDEQLADEATADVLTSDEPTEPNETDANSRPGAIAQPSSFLSDESLEEDVHATPDLPDAPPVLPTTPSKPPLGTPTRLMPGGPAIPSAPTGFGDSESEDKPFPLKSPPSARPAAAPPVPAPVTPQKSVSKADISNILDESEVVSGAQKHAKYAISALNYDDMDTAVKELTTALKLLNDFRATH